MDHVHAFTVRKAQEQIARQNKGETTTPASAESATTIRKSNKKTHDASSSSVFVPQPKFNLLSKATPPMPVKYDIDYEKSEDIHNLESPDFVPTGMMRQKLYPLFLAHAWALRPVTDVLSTEIFNHAFSTAITTCSEDALPIHFNRDDKTITLDNFPKKTQKGERSYTFPAYLPQ